MINARKFGMEKSLITVFEQCKGRLLYRFSVPQSCCCIFSSYTFLGRRIAPVKLTPNISQVILERSSSFSIECEGSDVKKLKDSYIKWFKVNASGSYPVEPTSVEQKISFGNDVKVLTLENITKEMQGLYTCQRKVKTEPYTSAGFNLFVKGNLDFFDQITIRNRKRKLGKM